MRLHRLLADACVEVLDGVFHQAKVVDRTLDALFRQHPKWGRRDRSFVAETVYELVRWRRHYALLAGTDEIRRMLGLRWTEVGYARPEWAFWPEMTPLQPDARAALLSTQSRAVRESVPDRLDDIGAEELGPRWDRELAALNASAPVFLRINPLRTTRDELRQWLLDKDVETEAVPELPSALQVTGSRLIAPILLREGLFEIQDAASQLVAPFLGVEPGHRVLDACAGAGGKTLHLAALMQGKGELRALDVSAGKLDALRERATRAGVAKLIRCEVISDAVLQNCRGWADRLLIDSPCSGLGTLRRQPDLKWRITPESLETTRRLQSELLDRYCALLRPGGEMVYATCSILPSENQLQVERFLTRHPEFEQTGEQAVSPADTGYDGFYMARLRHQ